MTAKILNNIRIIDPLNSLDITGCIIVENGLIKEVLYEILSFEQAKKIIKDEHELEFYDLKGKVAVPGLIDIHTHLRDPGFEHKETIASGTGAAVKGGFTTVCAMPNTDPPLDNAASVSYINKTSVETGYCNVLPIGCITKGRNGVEIAEYGELKQAGAKALSDDGNTVMSSLVMRRAMEYASNFGLTIMNHCEDENLAGEGQVNEGYYSTMLGLEGFPREAEDIIIDRDIKLAELTGSKLHICHISTKKSVELIRQAKLKGLPITAEACPHHFSLTDKELLFFDTSAKVKPPLRSQEDVDAIVEGIKDNTIDVIATDHAPHARHEKEVEFDYAPFGITGLETALPVTLTFLYHNNLLSLNETINKLTLNPARVLGADLPGFQVERAADITIIDLEKTKEVKKSELVSKGTNTPFLNMQLKGWPVMTLVNGEVKYVGEEVN